MWVITIISRCQPGNVGTATLARRHCIPTLARENEGSSKTSTQI